jgi:RES domain-containing protein
VKGTLSVKVTRGRTGREGFNLINDRPTAHPDVQRFAMELCGGIETPRKRWLRPSWWRWWWLRRSIARLIREQIEAAASTGITGTFYRGRLFAPELTQPRSADLGLPPADRQGVGRYNESGSRVLYLARSPTVALAELERSACKPLLFIQEFQLSLSSGKVLRLCDDLEVRFPHLHYLLLDSEYIPEENPYVPDPYRATHFIAAVCRSLGISGVEYPSIRGGYTHDRNAINLVLFDKAAEDACRMMVGEPALYEAETRYLRARRSGESTRR